MDKFFGIFESRSLPRAGYSIFTELFTDSAKAYRYLVSWAKAYWKGSSYDIVEDEENLCVHLYLRHEKYVTYEVIDFNLIG